MEYLLLFLDALLKKEHQQPHQNHKTQRHWQDSEDGP